MKTLIIGIFSLILLASCGGSKQSSETKSTTLIDALTDFSIAINANNYEKAVDFLIDSEKNQLIDASGKVTEENQRKLKALRLQVLIKNPRIQLSGNKITGMLSALPNLEHSGPSEMGADPLGVDTQLENVEESGESGSEMSDEGTTEGSDEMPMDNEPEMDSGEDSNLDSEMESGDME